MKNSSKNKPVRKLKDVRPEVRDFWDGHENRKVFFLGFDDVLENSRERYFWKCPECNAAMRYPATTVATYGIRCDRCREREAKERRLENEEKKRAAREAKAKREAKSPTSAQAAPTQRTPRGCSETGETAVIGRNIKTGELVRFDTARAAAESIGSRWTSDVTKVCRGVSGHRSAGGFEWRWESEAPAEWFDGAPSARDDERADPDASERHDDLATSTPTDASSVQAASKPQDGEKSATEERGEGEALAELDEGAMQLQYATSFSVESATGAGNVWPLVVESVYDWFDYKDRASAKSWISTLRARGALTWRFPRRQR